MLYNICWSIAPYSSHSFGSYCHDLVTSFTTLYSTGVNCGDALCSPNQNRTWFLENFLDTSGQLSATNHPAMCPQPVKFLAIFSLVTVSPSPAKQPVVFPSVLISPVPVNHQHIIDLRTICPVVVTPRIGSYSCQPQSCEYRPLNFVSSTCQTLR